MTTDPKRFGGEKRKPHLVSVPVKLYDAIETAARERGLSAGELARSVLRAWENPTGWQMPPRSGAVAPPAVPPPRVVVTATDPITEIELPPDPSAAPRHLASVPPEPAPPSTDEMPPACGESAPPGYWEHRGIPGTVHEGTRITTMPGVKTALQAERDAARTAPAPAAIDPRPAPQQLPAGRQPDPDFDSPDALAEAEQLLARSRKVVPF